MRSLR